MNRVKKVFCYECDSYRGMLGLTSTPCGGKCCHPNNLKDTFFKPKCQPIKPMELLNLSNNCGWFKKNKGKVKSFYDFQHGGGK